MDLWQFYERVEDLIVTFRKDGHPVEADAVEAAIRGGATSGEILGRLGRALADASPAVPERSADVAELEAFVRDASRLRP